MRAECRSIEEISRHWGCPVRSMEELRSVLPYELAAYYGRGSLRSALDTTIPILRRDYELTEIYVRVLEQPTFWNFTPRHFDLFPPETKWEWVAVVRGRDYHAPPRIVGIMLAKDEADIIPDVLRHLSQHLDALYYFAGDDKTAACVAACAPSGWARAVCIPPNLPHADGLRQYLLAAARYDNQVAGDMRPMWIIVVQGDEIYHDDLRRYVLRAHEERSTMMTCQVATFLLHESQRDGWDWSKPLNERLTHYIWDFGEHTGFLDHPWDWYDIQEHMRAHPHDTFPEIFAPARPVRKHYPFRSPTQARARIADRLRATPDRTQGWQPHYKNYEQIFVGDIAAGREVHRFQGDFPEAERIRGFQ